MILGKPNSGKTVFSAQLYGRLTRGSGQQVALRHTPDDLSLFQEALEKLAEGESPQRTTSSQFSNVSLPLSINNSTKIDLTWFDYAGEQLTHIYNTRSVNDQWVQSLKESHGWMVFIRLNDESRIKHRIQDLVLNKSHPQINTQEDSSSDITDTNVWWIEIFQILIHICELKSQTKISSPKLAIILSCYDQIDDFPDSCPKDIFEKELPLLSQFLNSNWNKKEISIWGLSSLGMPLDEGSQDDFVDNGPENQGWIIPSNAEKSSDLTLPLAWMYENL